MKTLVVEDEEATRYFLERVLRARGHEVVACAHAEEAWQAYVNNNFSMIVLDWGLPDADGLELCKKMRSFPNGEETVVLFCSGRPQPDDLDEVLLAGVDDYLAKPIDYRKLNDRLAVVEQRVRHNQERRNIEAKLREVSGQLEASVEQRNIELAKANEELQRKVAEQQQTQEAFRNSEALYHSLVENLPLNVFRKDIDSRFTFGNQLFCQAMGKPLGDILGQSDYDFFPVHLASKYHADDRRVIETQQIFETVEEHRGPSGDIRWVQSVKSPIFDAVGAVVGIQGIFWDITQKRQAEEALRQSEERYALAAQGANDGLWDWNLKSGEIYFSRRWKAMLGHGENEIGDQPHEWFDRIHPDDLDRVKAQIELHLRRHTPHFEAEHRMKHQNGDYRWMLSRGIALRDPNENAHRMAGSQTDITERKRAEQQLVHDAFHDGLTGLPNRALFLDRLERSLQYAKRRQRFMCAVLYLDLDRFQVVNDSLSHSVGDQLLIAVAKRLETCLRPGDTVARVGGDEFVILLDDIRDVSDATRVAERILDEFKTPFRVKAHEVFSNVSIGIALSASGYERAEDVVRDADIAMNRSKGSAVGRHVVFDRQMHAFAVSRLKLETDLRRAVDRREFELHYQPIVSLLTGRVTGFEALLRWRSPERGIVSPLDFIPLAEETGLILPIGEWVLEEACRQTQEWHTQINGHLGAKLSISVNVSSRQFAQPDLIDRIDRVVRETGFDVRCLKLEITESVMMHNAESVTATLLQLRALDLQLCVDDFGTGYSSLAYLHHFPIDTLKIDRSFVSKMCEGGKEAEIVRTILTLAKNLNIDVVAEGVETSDQLKALRDLGCQNGQGYFFGKPLEAHAAYRFVTQNPSW